MKITYQFTFLLVFLLAISGFAEETNKIDSLKSIMLKASVDTIKVNLLNKISYEYEYHDSKNAEKYAKEAIELSRKSNYIIGLAEATRLYANSLSYKREFANALEIYNESLKLFMELNDKDGVSTCYVNIGVVYFSRDEYLKASDYFKKAATIFEEINDNIKASVCYNNMGIIYTKLGNYPLAIENYLIALYIFEKMDDKSRMSSCLNNIGILYKKLNDFENALKYYRKSLNIKYELDDKIGIAACFNNIGIVLCFLNKYTEALTYNKKALKVYSNLQDSIGIASAFHQIGTILSKLEKYDDAIMYFEKSIEINTKAENKAGIGSTYAAIGKTLLETGKIHESLEYANKAYIIAKDINDKSLIKETLEILALCHYELRNYKKAIEYFIDFKTQSDSLLNADNIRNLTSQEYQYKIDKQKLAQKLELQKREEIHKEKLKRKNIIQNAFLFGIILLILLLFLIFRNYKIKQKANIELTKKNKLISKQKEDITDSIKYAKRIQNAVLPQEQNIEDSINDYFILFKPRDIVSGDFYWTTKKDGQVIIAAADCTGHGVPGAFMSMLGISFLNEIVNKYEFSKASDILNILRQHIINTLGQTGKSDEAKDGMDIALCIIDYNKMFLQFAGAYNPLYLIRNGELSITKGDKMPIGIYITEQKNFSNHEFSLNKGDTIYLFSDGYADQFGGSKAGKFMTKPFKKLLLEIQNETMKRQKEILNETIEKWKGNLDQIDDILVIGIKI